MHIGLSGETSLQLSERLAGVDFFRAAQDQVQQFQRAQEELMAVNLLHINPFQAAFEEVNRQITWAQSFQESLFESVQRIQQSIDTVFETQRRQLAELFEWSDFHTVKDLAGDTGVQLSELTEFLLERSWAMPPDAPLSFVLLLSDILFFEQDHEQIEEELELHFSARVDEIEEAAKRLFPKRARLVKDAIDAHRNGKYSLSITALLPQIDGMWNDMAKEHFYCNRSERTVGKALGSPNNLPRPIMRTLQNPGAIRIGTRSRARNLGALNRHAVLHGYETDFDTQRNSLRALSWASFLCSVRGIRQGN